MKYVKKIDPSFVNVYKDKLPPWGPLGYIIYKRTYARKTEDGVTEEWYQTIERCCQGILDIGGVFTQDEIELLYDMVFNLKCCFSGRALWQLGTDSVQKIGADSLQNCWHVTIDNPEAFCFIFNELMLGGGVGFTITPEYVYELPHIKYGVAIKRTDKHDVDFIVPDNREGWVELLRKILNCFFVTGKNLVYSTACIRSKGKPIKGFGGIASGSENLVDGITKIVGILKGRINRKLRPIDCLDIANIIGSIVVAGNIRRSAELAAGSLSDTYFLKAKNWGESTIPGWRQISNNSVICDNINDLNDDFWETYEGQSEPYGLINLNLCREYGRLVDPVNYRPDSRVSGTNPCAEIPLESYEACNLAELFLPNLKTLAEFINAAGLMYKVCKTISCYPFSNPKVNEVVDRNHRIGIGCTGVLQSEWVHEPRHFNDVYRYLEDADNIYSRELKTNTSIKLTTVKPSGTLSLLPGVTSGIHSAYAYHYIRRVRFQPNDPLIDICREAGYPIEPQLNLDGSPDLGTIIVSFPIKTPKSTIVAENLSISDQLEFQHLMQYWWADNAVSMTCYYKQEELPVLKELIEKHYTESIKTASFLPHKEHGFLQAPYEEIDESKFRELSNNIREPIQQFTETSEREFTENFECASGTCPIR